MDDLERWDALTDEQRERVTQNVAQAMQSLAAMGQEAMDLIMQWAEEVMPILQSLCAALLTLQRDVEQIKEQGDEPARVYPGYHGNGVSLRAPKHAGLRDNQRR